MFGRRIVTLAAVAGALLLLGHLTAAAQPACAFTLGFATLKELIPEIVGECVSNEVHNPVNGDALQETTVGLLAWRKADNQTVFTDGSTTWLNGPCGLQSRSNQGPFFAWEGRETPTCTTGTMAKPYSPIAKPQPLTQQPPPPARPAPAPPPPAPPAPADRAPILTLHYPTSAETDQRFEIRLEATDDRGLTRVSWHAEGSGGGDLRSTRTRECSGQVSCSFTWSESTDDAGQVTIVASAVDTAGALVTVTRSFQVVETFSDNDLDNGTDSDSDNDSDNDGGGGCDPSYPGVCIESPPPDLDCGDVPYENFVVRGSDPHRFDGDKDGRGCE